MSQNVYCISLVLALLAATTFSQNPYGGGYSASGVAPPAAAPPPSAAASAAPPPPQQASSAAPPPPPPAPASAAGTGYSQEQAAAAPPPASPPPPPPAAAAYPAPAPPAPAPSAPVQQTGYGADLSKTHGASNLGFPLPSCYINKDGFMCCNKELENLMDNTYRNLSQSRNGKWKKCNIHQVAVATQRNAQKHFGVDFELVVGAGDYASKNYFNQDLICKIRRDNSIILAFATPN